MIKELFDVQYLPDYDYDESRIIITNDFNNVYLNNLNNFSSFIEQRLEQSGQKPVSGNVYVITDESGFKKLYVIYLQIGGIGFTKKVQYLNVESGEEVNYNLSQSDYEAMKQCPLFAGEDDTELTFLLATLEETITYTPDAYGAEMVRSILEFTNQGLWLVTANQNWGEGLEVYENMFGGERPLDMFGARLFVSGKIIVGPYESIKQLYLSGNNREIMKLGGRVQEGYVLKMILDYTDMLKTEYNEQEKVIENQAIAENPVVVNPYEKAKVETQNEQSWDAFAESELLVEEELTKTRTKKKKNVPDASEITEQEKMMAAQQIAAEKVEKIKTRKRSKNLDRLPIDISQAKNNIAAATTVTLPSDWDYVYTLEETSAMYNATIGKRYLIEKKEWIDDDEQKTGMSIEEWNAYFVSNPQYSHLIQPAIGHWGGMSYNEEQLRQSGVLLYNPMLKKLQYIHEYLRGNAYERMDETVAAKDIIVSLYGEEFYDVQMTKIKSVTPERKRINDPDSSQAPFVHPLDDININIMLKTAGGLTFSRNENPKIVKQYKKFLRDQRTSSTSRTPGYTPPSTATITQEEENLYLSQPQELNIVVFFKNWLAQGENHGTYYVKNEIPIPRTISFSRLDRRGRSYGTESEYVNAVEQFFFGNKGFKDFAAYASGGVDSWNLVNPATGQPYTRPDEVGKSEFFEFKDNLKRMVNQAFQDFITQELENEDIERLNDAWNRRYNGFIKIDVYKYPIFLRHRKYFKDVTKKIRFMLDKSQVEGIKFGTINNSSIMAHEVGYGKTTLSIAYMSHMFETNQASNIMVAVPKALYENSKWKEEIMGKDDVKRGQKILGISPPEYNLIELGNLTPTLIFGKTLKTDRKAGSKTLSGSSQYKNYSFDEVANIEDFKEMRDNFEKAGYDPKDAYKVADFIAGKDGVLEIIDQLKAVDSVLYKKCSGDDSEFITSVIDMFNATGTKFWGTTKDDKHKKMIEIGYEIIIMELFNDLDANEYRSTIEDSLYSEIEKKRQLQEQYKNNPGDTSLLKQIDDSYSFILNAPYFEAKLNKKVDLYKRDKDGKIISTIDPQTQILIKERRPLYEAMEEYIAETIGSDIYDWMYGVLNKMYENAIYEYGQWKFNAANKNIFLVSHEALKRIGFGPTAIETVIQRVTEFSSYQEPVFAKQIEDEDDIYYQRVISVDASAAKDLSGRFKRGQKKVMEQQYAAVINKVNETMTFNSQDGKLMVDSLSIDGFIFDEAHKGKKLFTNAVSDSVFQVFDEKGDEYRIRKSAHDIHGGGSSDLAVQMFGMCQYVRSLGDTKPVMLLTATPFSNQPTEIFTMLAMVGVKQMREQGVANVKNFFDLFLNETLKYTFDHTGQFVKRVTVEDFRNKELLLQMIWSVIDIKREETRIREFEEEIKRLMAEGLSEKERDEKMKSMKPSRLVLPQLKSKGSYVVQKTQDSDQARKRDKNKDCDDFKQVTTSSTAQLKQDLSMVASIVNRNKVQEEIMADLEKVALAIPNPNNPMKNPDGSPKLDENNMPMYYPYTFKDICPDVVVNNESEKPEQDSYTVVSQTAANEIDNQLVITKKGNEGRVFKTLALSQAVALSPYFYNCYDLPEPTPENVIKLSPKLEYLVKALISVKKYHLEEIPKIIKTTQAELDKLSSKPTLTPDEINTINALRSKLPRLNAALKVSGQVVYLNKVRFKYKGENYNMVEIIREYLVKEGTFSRDEVGYVGTGGDPVEKTIKDFQDGKLQVLFGTPAIKEGVDLQQNGSILYVLTPDWNPTDMRQIEGRIWRRGNPYRQIRVVYILLDQSVEIFVYAKLEEKSLRLKKIMQERNYVLELEEMSLDPKETQIALASDPRRRVDIITKTCLEILKERRQKLEVNNRALKEYAETAAFVSDNIEAYYQDYMLGYFDAKMNQYQEYVNITKKYIEEYYDSNKDAFIRSFCYTYTKNLLIGDYCWVGKKVSENYSLIQKKLETLQNKSIYLGMAIIGIGTNPEGNVADWAYSIRWDKDMCMDYLSALKTVIENKTEFNDPNTNKDALLDTLLPMRYTSSVQESGVARRKALYNLPENSLMMYAGSSNKEPFTIGFDGNNNEIIKLFTGGSIMCMPSHLQKLILNTINNILNSPNMSRNEMGQAMAAIVPTITNDLIGIVANDATNKGFVSPANEPKVLEAESKLENIQKAKDEVETMFPSYSIIRKAQRINRFDDNEIKEIRSSLNVLTKPELDKISQGKTPSYKTPAEYGKYLLPLIGVQIGIVPDFSGYTSLYDPISSLGDKAKDIRSELASVGVTDEGQIGYVYEKAREKLDQVNTSISDIEDSKELLLDKYKRELEEKKKISLDDVIVAFSKLNSILQDRSPEETK